jgi:5-methyltetrahydrofolate--homocysteine methyltransferase
MAGGGRGREVVERVRAGEILVFDGGYGTALFAAGLVDGACPELWNDTHPEVVRGIHKGYFDAGSDLVETNTFGGSRLKLGEYQLGDRTRELNVKGAELARSVCPPGRWVAGSIGPTSRLPAEYEPLGDTTDDEYFETFKEQATMFFQYEEMHDRDRTMWGESPAEVARNLLRAGADIVGMNCGRGPDRAIAIIREMRAVTDAPLIAYPNAGLPITKGAETTYELGPEAMARDYPALLDAGCSIVGGCCGSGPEHIRLIAEVARSRRPR